VPPRGTLKDPKETIATTDASQETEVRCRQTLRDVWAWARVRSSGITVTARNGRPIERVFERRLRRRNPVLGRLGGRESLLRVKVL
jgi:hypothetical protein